MRIKDYSNEQLVREFEHACFRFTNYPSNKTIANRFTKLEEEICKRLKCDIEKVREEIQTEGEKE